MIFPLLGTVSMEESPNGISVSLTQRPINARNYGGY